MTDYKQLCAELLDELQYQTDWSIAEELKERARAALAEPEPKRFTVEKISNLSQHRENYIVEDHRDGEIQLDGYFSRADLQQLADSILSAKVILRITAMTDLSPAAQAVLTAFGKHPVHADHIANNLIHGALPAAIEALVDEVISKVPPPCEDFDEYAQGYLAANIKYRSQILAIAAELRSDFTQENN